MRIGQLDQIGLRVAKRVAAKYGHLEITFFTSIALEGENYGATVLIAQKEAGGDTMYEIPEVNRTLSLSSEEAETYLEHVINEHAQSFMRLVANDTHNPWL